MTQGYEDTRTDDAGSDPLADLVVNLRDVDREKLAKLCRGRVMVDPQANRMILGREVRGSATVPQKILLALLAQRVLNLLNRELSMGMTPKELEQATGVKGGSLRPALMRLANRAVIYKDGDSYVVPSNCLDQVGAELEDVE